MYETKPLGLLPEDIVINNTSGEPTRDLRVQHTEIIQFERNRDWNLADSTIAEIRKFHSYGPDLSKRNYKKIVESIFESSSNEPASPLYQAVTYFGEHCQELSKARQRFISRDSTLLKAMQQNIEWVHFRTFPDKERADITNIVLSFSAGYARYNMGVGMDIHLLRNGDSFIRVGPQLFYEFNGEILSFKGNEDEMAFTRQGLILGLDEMKYLSIPRRPTIELPTFTRTKS